MTGGIYSDQRCPECGGKFRDDKKKGLFCPEHPDRQATKFKVIFRDVTRRFTSYHAAHTFLTGLRHEANQGKFDSRDYRVDKPLGFANLAESYLSKKAEQRIVTTSHLRNLRNYMNRAIAEWGNRNIRNIDYAEIEDCLDNQRSTLSGKTVSNMRSCLHDFWTWLVKRKVIHRHEMPEFPECPFELAYRSTVDKDTQQAILDEIYRITYHINPKIWIGIKWLCTYISIRPHELLSMLTEDIDLDTEHFRLRPKGKRGTLRREIRIIKEDIELIKSLPRSFPKTRFFRHVAGIKGCKEGKPFGEKYLYKKWKEACKNLGIEGVDLYGGSRHSSARGLRKQHSPETIKKATMHSTNKAFERYLWLDDDDIVPLYSDAAPKSCLHSDQEADKRDKALTNKSRSAKTNQLIDFAVK